MPEPAFYARRVPQPQTRSGIAACAICRKQLARRKPTAKAKSGLLCHPWCLEKATKAGKGSTAKAAPKPTISSDDSWGPPPPRTPVRRALPTSPFAKQQSEELPQCPLCGLPRKPADPLAETADGWAHLACADADAEPYSGPGAKAFAKNKERVESGKTFAGRKPSGYRVGTSPSSVREVRH